MKKFFKGKNIVIFLSLFLLSFFLYWGVSSYTPPMKENETRIGVITTSLEKRAGNWLVYDENLTLKRKHSLNYTGVGMYENRHPIQQQNIFFEMIGQFETGKIKEYLSLDMEKEKVAKYPSSLGAGLTAVAANQKYAYSVTNRNGVCTITQSRHSDKAEVNTYVIGQLVEMIAATDKYLFLGVTLDLLTFDRSCDIQVLDAESLKEIRTISLTRHGKLSWNTHLIADGYLYIPLYYQSPLQKESEPTGEKPLITEKPSESEEIPAATPEWEEMDIGFDEKELTKEYNNKIVRLNMSSFQYTILDLVKPTPTQIEKHGDYLFVVHENTTDYNIYLTIYNEKTDEETIHKMEDMFYAKIALSDNQLYLLGVKGKKDGYFHLYQYDIVDDTKLELKNKTMVDTSNLWAEQTVSGFYVYTKAK